MFEIILGAVWSFFAILICFLCFLGGSYIGMGLSVLGLAVGVFGVIDGLRKNSKTTAEIEEEEVAEIAEEDNTTYEECYGVLQQYLDSVHVKLLVYIPSLNKSIFQTFELEDGEETYTPGSCFVITYDQKSLEIEGTISYADIPEEYRSFLVVYSSPTATSNEEPVLYTSVSENQS